MENASHENPQKHFEQKDLESSCAVLGVKNEEQFYNSKHLTTNRFRMTAWRVTYIKKSCNVAIFL